MRVRRLTVATVICKLPAPDEERPMHVTSTREAPINRFHLVECDGQSDTVTLMCLSDALDERE
jgi:hypothetical protein